MKQLDLTAVEELELIRLLKRTLDNNHFPLASRLDPLKARTGALRRGTAAAIAKRRRRSRRTQQAKPIVSLW
jgi:hypothetical protein